MRTSRAHRPAERSEDRRHDARVPYGTAVFEGIRGNWNEERRRRKSSAGQSTSTPCPRVQILGLTLREDADTLCDIAAEITSPSGFSEDVYLRPIVYTRSEQLGVRLHNLEHDALVFVTPFPAYLPEVGRCHTSTWRRVNDTGSRRGRR